MSLSHSTVQQLLNRWDPTVTVTNTQFFEEGIETVAKVELKESKPVVLKVHHTDRYSSPRTFLADPYSMKLIKTCASTTIPTPEIKYISDQTPKNLDSPYYIMEYLNYPTGETVSNKTALRYFAELGKYLGETHSLPLQTDSDLYGWVGYIDGELQPFPKDNYISLESFITSELHTYHDRIQNQDRFSDWVAESATKLLEYLDETTILDNRPKCYCHRDIKEANTFITESGEIQGIIDWSPIIADPLYEFASIQMRLLESSEEPYPYATTTTEQKELIKTYHNNYFEYGPLAEPIDETVFTVYKAIIILRTLGSFNNWFNQFSTATQIESQEFNEQKLQRLLGEVL